ncbi:hypothetical protein GLYMA_15G123500v4 [Glycine max]|uniref:Uncharacterized protein n=2 Tax=Glycine subgen. Soja TaxID=1462606 RepID=A0A0R0FZU0_SOYBN|nr:hypothetical protein GLYMA_15G123500v4 [Glycine max]KAH1146823.1 hypothetical protein GYH30_042144 [Glycine max]KAH1146824.1 hypothetical protein GYH30_042144 [Glycine max]KRH11678.1 hypothetical protein GLYMA_15G123500v4 [Glycine max]RZB64269.1 hypothetical protein D0Y65_040704 [Glycine soja]
MIDKSINGAVHFMASNNDSGVRDFDMERFQLSKHFCFPWPKNHTSLSPDGKLVVIVGDYPEGLLVDSQTGKTITPFRGHLDFSFASAWHPDGHIFATGNQDKTCRVWDVRNLSKSVAVLKGNLGAIRSIRFTSDGHSSWRWPSQLTLCMCTTQSMDLRRSKRLIFLQNHSLLVFGTAPTEAFYSSIDAEK